MSTTSTPYGGLASAEHRRPIRPVGACASRSDVVSRAFRSNIAFMTDLDRPRSPFAGMADLSARKPVRVLSPDKIKQMLASHLLYLRPGYHEGHRANFSSADLTGTDFSGLDGAG